MKGYLLDTHAFLWWTGNPSRLPERLLATLRRQDARLVLSVASTWEMMVKIGLGKLTLTEGLESVIDREVNRNALELLPIAYSHSLALAELPPLHRDPFDRMLIAQASVESLILVSRDDLVRQYPLVETIWD
jgi:Uncharacterized protein conserved in bacteria